MRLVLLALAVLLAIVFMAIRLARTVPKVAAAMTNEGQQPALENPDAVCASCHARIYASYERTAMGRGSGTATSGLFPGDFTHNSSGITYRVFARDGKAWMSFARPDPSKGGPLQGERQLFYYVGSGKRGRTYLYKIDNQWFELPINWYGRRQQWDMAPAYDNTEAMPAALPVNEGCLHCHATSVETALPEAQNRFPQRPFDQGGVGCSACHGNPAQHLAAHGHGPILNPAKMNVAARDSACIQCHLEGDAVVDRPGHTPAHFVPGSNLFDFAVYFVRASQAAGGQRASSQYEALLRSACKRASGDKLTCTTCHDPHSEPAASDRVAFYRARCLGCHTSPQLAVAHHPEQQDCAVCHMPSRKTADISHEQVTGHDIERVPAASTETNKRWVPGEELIPVGAATYGDRELGLAYAQRAQKGDHIAAQRALALLKKAESAGADDEQVHVNLGFLEQVSGDVAQARREYATALRENPFSASALVNRAVLDASAGDLGEAVRLLDRLVRADPSRTLAGVDLLKLECRAGETDRAAALVEQLRSVNPDAPELRAYPHGASVCGSAGATK